MWWIVVLLASVATALRFIYRRGLRLSNEQAQRTDWMRRQMAENLPAGAPPLPWQLSSADLELATRLKAALEASGKPVRSQFAAGASGDNLEILPGRGWAYSEPIAILSPLWDPDSQSPATLVFVHESAETAIALIPDFSRLKRLGPAPSGRGTMYYRVKAGTDA